MKQRRLLSLTGLQTSQLPPFPSSSSPPSDLAPFLISLLLEALPLLDSIPTEASNSGEEWTHLSQKRYPSSAAPVDLYERTILVEGAEEEREETWALRRSVHADEATNKTASWAEFRECFKERHVECEGEYMSSVVAAEVFGTWMGEGGGMGVESTENSKTYTDFTLALAAMRHRIGRPILQDRVFPILQMTCSVAVRNPSPPSPQQDHQTTPSDSPSEFIIITIPVPDLFTHSEPPPQIQLTKIDTKNTTTGLYASVERFRKVEGGKIEWTMATASDARGILPRWIQDRAVPGQIGRDVPFFLEYISQRR